jgi:putative GTP pyrophosphokinase
MLQNAFAARYEAEKPIYNAWGQFVVQHIRDDLGNYLRSETAVNYFLRIPATHRTKAVDSLVEKAYYRGKSYVDPYTEITDKVGARFVVLLLDDIRTVGNLVEASPHWVYSKDRDFEEERAREPTLFDYQSVHYIVRAAQPFEYNGCLIPDGIPCEIQIRTLMQHAFSELTHDTIYKPRTLATSAVRRNVAKSMAFIETTDRLFQEVQMSLVEAASAADSLLSRLEDLYGELLGHLPSTNRRANSFILDALQPEWEDLEFESIREFANEYKTQVVRWIQERLETNFLYRQPTILLLYYLAQHQQINLTRDWPLTFDELRPVYTDIGRALAAG